MSQWHASIDQPTLTSGVRLSVISDHHVVRVVTADTLSIRTPSGQRLAAMVLDRTASHLRLILDDGSAVSLDMLLDERLGAAGDDPDVFSRQTWLTATPQPLPRKQREAAA